MSKVVVTKIDAAIRQLNCAIELFFQSGDPVPVHTLACAAHQIVNDINRAQSGPELIFDSISKCKGERKKLLIELRRYANYFKHADNDPCPNCGIRFSPQVTEVIIYSALLGLCNLNHRFSATQSAYIIYMQTHSELLLNTHWRKFVIKTDPPINTEKLESLSKECFFCEYIKAIEGDYEHSARFASS
jgi:hypothetical protein